MLFEVSNQFYITISFVWLGILIASISEFLLIKSNKKWLTIINNFLLGIITVLVFFVWITKFGETIFRFYYIICFLVGFILEKIFWHKIIANCKKMIYNRLNKYFATYRLKLRNRLLQKKTKRKMRKIKNIKSQ